LRSRDDHEKDNEASDNNDLCEHQMKMLINFS